MPPSHSRRPRSSRLTQRADDAPKSLRDPAIRARRLAMLERAHIAPLTRFVVTLRRAQRCADCVPNFDPMDGGVQARALFLLEAPGAKAVASGFISRNNDDETAKNMLGLLAQADLARRDTVLWNVVPWYLGDEGRIRNATSADFSLSRAALHRLLLVLTRVRVVVLVGLSAQTAWDAAATTTDARVLRTWHPSPQSLNTDGGVRRGEILTTFRDARRILTRRQPRQTPIVGRARRARA
jgi:uracil-DNA glycosylase